MIHDLTLSRLFSESERENFKEWLNFVADFIKICTLIATPLGLFLLNAYLSNVGAPMLAPDASTVITFLLIVAAYVFLISSVSVIFFAPVYLCHVKSRTRKIIRTENYKSKMLYKKLSLILSSELGRKRYKSEYVVFHSSSLFMFVSLMLGSIASFSPIALLISVSTSIVIGCFVSALRYKYWRAVPKCRSDYLKQKFMKTAIQQIVVGNLSRSIIAMFWALAIIQIVLVFFGVILTLIESTMPIYYFLHSQYCYFYICFLQMLVHEPLDYHL